jgi:S-DNA-T family DNA segregation ATPase FtsK/SpoIIIE
MPAIKLPLAATITPIFMTKLLLIFSPTEKVFPSRNYQEMLILAWFTLCGFGYPEISELPFHSIFMPKKPSNKAKTKRPRQNEPERAPIKINPRIRRDFIALFIALSAIVALLAVLGGGGLIGAWLEPVLAAVFGLGKYLIPVALAYWSISLVFGERVAVGTMTKVGLSGLFLTMLALLNVVGFKTTEAILFPDNLANGGGYVGLAIGYPALYLLGFWGGLFLIVICLLASVAILLNASLSELLAKLRLEQRLAAMNPFKKRRRADLVDGGAASSNENISHGFASRAVEATDDVEIEAAVAPGPTDAVAEKSVGELICELPRPRKRRRYISLPMDLLENQHGKPAGGDTTARMFAIQKTLDNFGIPVEMGDISVGPTVTQYTLKPADGVKVSRIISLSNDLALSLAAHPIRIEAPIPGKSLIGIEVPNQAIAVVTLREVIESRAFRDRRDGLTFCLGKDVAGMPWVANLARMPHMLVAGATGSGKTVCLNAIIVSLLYANSPDDLKLILVDPKRVELPIYNGIPHLLTPAITEVPKTINAFKWAIGEMDRRFELLSRYQKRDIASFNESANPDEKLPNIVIVVDELADLMVAAAAEIEAGIIRLAQMARAVGIHLIVATQRPSVDVITGLIKANIPARIAFSVASSTDSRTILDTTGAEKLVGRGDMLFQTAELSKPKRIQCCYVGDREIRRVVDHLKGQLEEPIEYNEAVTSKKGVGVGYGNGDAGDGDDDDLYDEAKATVVKAGKASASYLQRRLKVGYARAARLLDLLEERGIIGPGEGAKPREILVNAIRDEDGVHVFGDLENEDEKV